ncbi:MAG: hypothetical protein AAF310_02665 [Myxococcota bacterium]
MASAYKHEAKKAAAVLEKSLKGSLHQLTIADAAAQSGLSLHDAQLGLHHLVGEYRGHLSVTDKGEILFSLPHAFTKPWERGDRLKRWWGKIKRAAWGAAQFFVRAWISVVLVGYVVIFAVVLLALSAAGRSSERNDGPSFGSTLLLHTLLRVVLDSLFWTFHPFSPFYVGHTYSQARRQRASIPFYEKVNRFFFGPQPQPEDPRATIRILLAEIRAQAGRIALYDAMKVTGLSKEQLDPILSRLMLDYEGDVTVSDEGALIYQFPQLRRSSEVTAALHPTPIWQKREPLLPFTGNSGGSNLLIAGLNGFNLLMSMVAIEGGWTLDKLRYIIQASSSQIPPELLPPAPVGEALFLGWVPFVFSLALFALPIGRWLLRNRENKRVQTVNGQRGILRAVLTQLSERGLPESALRKAWQQAAQSSPSEQQLTRAVVELGGQLHIEEDGSTFYRFPELAQEVRALQQQRQEASDEEVRVGDVVFSTK